MDLDVYVKKKKKNAVEVDPNKITKLFPEGRRIGLRDSRFWSLRTEKRTEDILTKRNEFQSLRTDRDPEEREKNCDRTYG